MRIELHVFLHDATDEHLLPLINQILHKVNAIMATLDDVVAKVTALQTVDDSVVALLTDLKTKLDAAIAANDPVKLQALSDALGAQTDRLSKAVTDNTPAA